MKRIFIAIKIPETEEVTQLLNTLRKSLSGERIKWVEPLNIHITLAFLGELNDERIDKTKQVAGGYLEGEERFKLDLRSVGIFSGSRGAKVIWLGIDHSMCLESFQGDLAILLAENNLYDNSRKFAPHITIGRVKGHVPLERVRTVTERFNNKYFGSVNVDEIILYESILKPAGPLYKPLEIFGLNAMTSYNSQ